MRKKYMILPRARHFLDDDQVIETFHATTVFEKESTPVPTGILDEGGNEIYYAYKMDQIGFIRNEEE